MIRRFTNDDRKKVLDIFILNTPVYFDPQEQKDLEAYLDKYSDTYFVFEHDGKIIGCGGYHFNDDKTIGRISWDFFHPDSKGMGFGSQLVAHCLYLIKLESSVRSIAVWTSQLAFHFYEKFGFELKEIKKDFWGIGLDLYLMEIDKGSGY